MPDRDEGTGKYTGTYSIQDFLSAIDEEGGMAGTGEIAQHVACAHDTAYKRLQQIEEDGLVTSKNVGNTLLWTIQPHEEADT